METVPAAIRTRGLTKRYGSAVGIEGLDLGIERGEVFGFLGANGAGKTTTMRLLVGLIHPTAGTAEVDGHTLEDDGTAIRRAVGYLPGDPAFPKRTTGESFLAYLARIRGGIHPSSYRALAERLQLDLRRRVDELSRGNRQKLGVVQALMHDPRVLILDEPTSGLDPFIQAEFHAIVRERADRGATVMLSSHVLAEVERMADRVGIVAEGRLILVDSVDGLRERATRRIELDFDGTPPAGLAAIPGVGDVRVHGRTATCSVTGTAGALLTYATSHGLVDAHMHEPDLETAFLGATAGGMP